MVSNVSFHLSAASYAGSFMHEISFFGTVSAQSSNFFRERWWVTKRKRGPCVRKGALHSVVDKYYFGTLSELSVSGIEPKSLWMHAKSSNWCIRSATAYNIHTHTSICVCMCSCICDIKVCTEGGVRLTCVSILYPARTSLWVMDFGWTPVIVESFHPVLAWSRLSMVWCSRCFFG